MGEIGIFCVLEDYWEFGWWVVVGFICVIGCDGECGLVFFMLMNGVCSLEFDCEEFDWDGGECGFCGDGICEYDEGLGDCLDCSFCGDVICGVGFEDDVVNVEYYCLVDCVYCGNGICDIDEDSVSCFVDCYVCGDGFC